MTSQDFLVAIAAGLAACALYVAQAAVGLLGAPLVLLSPLPVALVVLGWGVRSGILAAIVGTVGVAALMVAGGAPAGLDAAAASVDASLLNPIVLFPGGDFALLIAGPIAFYAWLAALARPRDASDGGSPSEWFPLRSILTAIAGGTAVTLFAAGLFAGYTADAFVSEMRSLLADLNGITTDTSEFEAELLAAARSWAAALPWALGLMLTLAMAFNLWLASLISHRSGRFRRPPPAVAATVDLPLLAVAVYAGSLLLARGDTGVASAANAVSGAFSMAFAIVGFAVLHILTRGLPGRPLLLAVAYTLAVLLNFLAIHAVAVVGIADGVLKLRARALRGRRRPPTT